MHLKEYRNSNYSSTSLLSAIASESAEITTENECTVITVKRTCSTEAEADRCIMKKK